jgi:Leucine-rich repeat (LRR) protein
MQKKQLFRPMILGLWVFSIFFLGPRVLAQLPEQDSLAVRIILDVNGLTTVPVSEVAKTNASKRIVSLDLSSRKLTAITSEIGVISELTSLYLNDNLLDSLPAEIWDLDKLITLDLSNNKLLIIDQRISHLQNLHFLGLNDNALITLPSGLFTLEVLDILLVSRNYLDTLPEDLANLVFLKYLNASDNQLRTMPLGMAAMNQLDSLDLRGNVITYLPNVIVELTNPKIYLGDNQLCNLPAQVDAWATTKDPTWKEAQVCGLALRPGNRLTHFPAIQIAMESGTGTGNLKLDLSNLMENSSDEGLEVSVFNLQGIRFYHRNTKTARLSISSQELKRYSGQLWIEVRSKGQLLATQSFLFLH